MSGRTTKIAAIIAVFLASTFAGCANNAPRTVQIDENEREAAPALVLGAFEDDYGITYSVTDSSWRQHPAAAMTVVEWDSTAQFVIVQNAETDSIGQKRYTRVDWLTLDGFPPYTWAYCYSIYDAETVDLARNADPPERETPRTGCNGFPFSRMQPVN